MHAERLICCRGKGFRMIRVWGQSTVGREREREMCVCMDEESGCNDGHRGVDEQVERRCWRLQETALEGEKLHRRRGVHFCRQTIASVVLSLLGCINRTFGWTMMLMMMLHFTSDVRFFFFVSTSCSLTHFSSREFAFMYTHIHLVTLLIIFPLHSTHKWKVEREKK